MAIGQGNFNVKKNSLKFTNSWELMNLSKSAEFLFYQFAESISGLTFSTHTYSESWQNFGYIAVLHINVASF